MALENKPSAYNTLLARATPLTSLGVKQTTLSPEKPRKRLKRSAEDSGEDSENGHSPSPRLRIKRREIPDSDIEIGDENVNGDEEETPTQRTDLEHALPPIKTDKEAIEEYETMRASQGALTSSEFHDKFGQREWIPGKTSIYIDAFHLALDTVLDDEKHLFNEAELAVFDRWRGLSYEAQYLYVRLFLRKTSAWHRINRLGYYSDIADLNAAVDELLRCRSLPECSDEASVSPGELAPPEGAQLGQICTFADSSDDHINSLEEASSLLKLDELRGVAKEAKVQGKNKGALLRALRRTSGKQTGLGFPGPHRSQSQDSENVTDITHDGSISPVKRDTCSNSRDEYFTQKILSSTGPCIRLSLAPFKLFERVHLVFYRSTEWTEKTLTTIILARIARRNFPSYIVSRSSNVFPSRALLLEFEAALRTQFRVDSILEFNGPPKQSDLLAILNIHDQVLPRWRVLLKEEQSKEDSVYSTGEGAYLRRLSPAWVYTRIIHKGAYVLSLKPFKDQAREHATLTELLHQRLFHHARRGAWYQRKALLEEHYMAPLTTRSHGRSQEEHKKHWKRTALATCEAGLQDTLVHVIYHYDLQKRLTKLERQLKIAKRFQHDFGHASLAKPAETTVYGIQIEKRKKPKPAPTPVFRRESSAGGNDPAVMIPGSASARNSGKTIWLDKLEGHGECSVESMCLSHYRSTAAGGWKGYHTEGGLLRTLFALLFYDVLFAYVPNVFQTPFQTCPLDLHTDAFYPARAAEVNARLAEIANGGAERILVETWSREGERRTCVVGLDWGFDLGDLREVVKCMGGEGLSVVCRVFSEEYGERGGGLPDLFLWRIEGDIGGDREGDDMEGGEERNRRGECKFVEVKSENDRLSDTQRLWIHVLTGAGFAVELCHALASEARVRE